MKQLYVTIFLTLSVLLFSLTALSGPGRTTYQAKIIKPDGSPLESSNVNFKFTILDPAGTCILYSETFSAVNMSSTGGLISFSLGSGVKTYPVSATTFEQVFSNITSSLSCDTGGPANYSPSANDIRKIVMQFHDGSGWQTLPAMSINAVPYAMYASDAQTLKGFSPLDFVQVSTVPTCAASEALRYTGAGFSCVAVGTGSGSVTSGSVISALGYTPASSAALGNFLQISNNLGDITSATIARANLGLGSFATKSQVDLSSIDVSGTLSAANLLDTGVTAATYTKVTVDSKGRVTSGSQFSASDITTVLGYTPANSATVASSQWNTSGTTINYMGGNVGIGTTSPSFKLEVSGSATGDRKIGINGKQVLYLPDQSSGAFMGSLFVGDGGGSVSHTFGSHGYYNTGVGIGALYSNTTGSHNTANGYYVLQNNTTGYSNSANGYYALQSNTNGFENTANGSYALQLNITGYHNTANGSFALQYATGSNNTAVGYGAGSAITTGSNNLILGSDDGSSIATSSNYVLIADGAGNRRMTIDNNGRAGIGTTIPVTKLDVSGGIRISMESATCAASYAGTLRYNAGNVEYCNGSTWSAFGVSGAVLQSLNGSASGTQSFAIGTGDIAPAFNTSNGVHTLSIPYASAGATTAGLISNADYLTFTNKMNNTSAAVIAALGYTPMVSGSVVSSQWNTSGTTINYMTGNVGIGTTSPSFKLEVSGTTVSDRKIGISGMQVLYLPDQTSNGFTGSLFVGDGGGSISHTAGVQGYRNTGVGIGALYSNTTGYDNTAIGYQALQANADGVYNTASGKGALYSNIYGSENTATGFEALYFNNYGSENTANGNLALQYNTTGSQNAAFGNYALRSNDTGDENTAIGHSALYSNIDGYQNTANGSSALLNNTSGSNNTANGADALRYNIDGFDNTANGVSALQNNTTGDANTANGIVALRSNTTGSYNTAIGTSALYTSKTKSEATAIGYYSMHYADSASAVVASSYNTALGAYSLQGSATPSANTGVRNTALGHSSLKNMTSGSSNTAVGYNAGSAITTGSNNVILGSDTGLSIATLSNYVLISDGEGNRRITINNSGSVGIGTTTPFTKLSVSGGVQISMESATCTVSYAGTLRYNSGSVEFCNSSAWTAFGTGSVTSASVISALGYTPANDTAVTNLSSTVATSFTTLTSNINSVSSSVSSLATSTAASFAAMTPSQWNTSGTAINYMAGNVGIGTANPTNKLDVNGSMTVGWPNLASVPANSLIVNNRIGVGVGNPSYALQVFGPFSDPVALFAENAGSTNGAAIQISASESGAKLWEFRTGGSASVGGLGALTFTNKTDGKTALTILPAGNVGIGTTTPAFKLELSGTTVTDKKIGINGKQVLYLPDQASNGFTGSLFVGDGGGSVSHTSGSQGYYNIGMGIGALFSNTTGYGNTANGFSALYLNTTGNYNTANGYSALYSTTTGSWNTANGSLALEYNTTGTNNTANGYTALRSNTTGHFNSAMGASALYFNTDGDHNTANGHEALYRNTTGGYNVAVGDDALLNNTSGYYNVGNGSSALYSNTSGGNNVGVGREALYSNTTGSANVAHGSYALYSSNTKSQSTAIGYYSMYYADSVSAAVTVSYNTALGAYSLQGSTTAANNTGLRNTALGHSSLKNMTSGSSNTAVGYNAGSAITTGSNNVILGSDNGSSIATLSNYVLIADGAGNRRMTIDGSGNLGIGTTTPSYKLEVHNTANGTTRNVASFQSVAATRNPRLSLTTTNTESGTMGFSLQTDSDAGVFPNLLLNTSGGNVGIGTTSLYSTFQVKTGTDQNVGIEGPVGAVSGSTLNVFNDAHNANVPLEIRSSATYLGLVGGSNVGIGTTTPGYKLDVNGTIRGFGITDSSDIRLKKNVMPLDLSLEKILQIEGVSYNWIDKERSAKKQIGFIAQQLEKIYPELVETDNKGMKSVNYSHLVTPLVEAIKSLYCRIVGIEERNNNQERQIASADAKIKQLEEKVAKVDKLEAENAALKVYLCSKDPAASICK